MSDVKGALTAETIGGEGVAHTDKCALAAATMTASFRSEMLSAAGVATQEGGERFSSYSRRTAGSERDAGNALEHGGKGVGL